MSRATTKNKRAKPQPSARTASSPKGAIASRLRAQTRKQLGKHYRAKYGVR